jgi:GT2 family glycosyltransferase
LADNASKDDSISYVVENFPLVKIIQNKANGGYAKGYNDALKDLKEDIFILLNSDVEVTQNWLLPLIAHFEKDKKTAIVQPKILSYQNKNKFDYAGASGGFVDVLGYPYCRGRIFETLEKDNGQYNDARKISWASGACLAIRKDIFFEAGQLDEDYFAHQEEIDLCWRTHHLGYQSWVIPKSEVYHLGGGTLHAMHPKKTFLNFRNSLFNLTKNLSPIKAIFSIFFRMVLDAVAGIKFLAEGKPRHFMAILKAHFSFYAHLPKMIKKRKKQYNKENFTSLTMIVWRYFILKKTKFSQLKNHS